jgi:hypothetical protein
LRASAPRWISTRCAPRCGLCLAGRARRPQAKGGERIAAYNRALLKEAVALLSSAYQQRALKQNLGSRGVRVRTGHWKTEGQGICPAHMNGFMALVRLPLDDETQARAASAAAAAAFRC